MNKSIEGIIYKPLNEVQENYKSNLNIANLLIAANTDQERFVFFYKEQLFLTNSYSRVAPVHVAMSEEGFIISYFFLDGKVYGSEYYKFKQHGKNTKLIIEFEGYAKRTLNSQILNNLIFACDEMKGSTLRFIKTASQSEVNELRIKSANAMKKKIVMLYIILFLIISIFSDTFVALIYASIISGVAGGITFEKGKKMWEFAIDFNVELKRKKSVAAYIPYIVVLLFVFMMLGLTIINHLLLIH